MTFMESVGYALFFVTIYLCVYALINRVCQCIEHCATARAYGKVQEAGMVVSMEALNNKIKNTEEKTKHEPEKACQSNSGNY